MGLILVASICMLCGCQTESNVTIEAPAVSGTFDFTVLKCGQADAIFMQTENSSIIVDCGEKDDGGKLVQLLQEKGISKLISVDFSEAEKAVETA